MKIYIAGKITGLELAHAAEMFHDAERLIAGQGHEALNPMTMVDQAEGRTYNEYLADALAIMLAADAVYFLANWGQSTGARIEHYIACELKMRRFFLITDIPTI